MPFPVSRSACGRATTKTTKPKVFGRVAPVRKGRIVGISCSLSIFVPHSAMLCGYGMSDDCSHLPGMLNSMPQCTSFTTHGHHVWKAVLRAKGFEGSFCQWWLSCGFRSFGAPASIPTVPPSAAVAFKIYESVALTTRSMEADLAKASRAYSSLAQRDQP